MTENRGPGPQIENNMKLLILGAGEYGQLVKELARNQYPTIDFLDDNSDAAIGKLEEYQNLKDQYQNAIVAIGNNEIRHQWLLKLEEAGYTLATLISDKAYVSPTATIEPGVIIEPMVVVNANTTIKKGSIISAGAVINHNAVVNEGSHIDCNAIVGADAIVPKLSKLYYGQVFAKIGKPDNWKFSE